MRVIDRNFTVWNGPRGAHWDGRSRSPARAPETRGQCMSGTDEAASAPITTRWALRGARLWSRVVLIIELAILALLASASAAHADTVVVALADSLTTVLDNVRNWIMGILAGLATVFLSVGGVRYVMGSGEPGEVEKAKSAFKSAGWGYGLAALAPLIVEILKGIVGA